MTPLITSIHAAHIAASSADLVLSDDDVKNGKGKGKGKGRKRSASEADASTPSSKRHHKDHHAKRGRHEDHHARRGRHEDHHARRGRHEDHHARRGIHEQQELQTKLLAEYEHNLEKLRQSLLDLDTNTLEYQVKYQQFIKESEAQRQQTIQHTKAKLTHDVEDFGQDCDDFFTALKKDYGELGSGDLDGAAAIAEINDLMFKLAKMFQELRNIVQEAKELFDQTSWEITVAAVDQKKTAIGDTETAAETAAICGMAAGAVSTVASFVGVFPRMSEGIGILGQSGGKIIEQAGAYESAKGTATADIEKTLAGLVEQSAEQFKKDINDAYARAAKTSSDMISLLTELVSLHRALLAALAKS